MDSTGDQKQTLVYVIKILQTGGLTHLQEQDSYLAIKNKSLVVSTFMYWGIYAGLTLFLGLLIFLLTRGKRNFNNYLKWYECLAISGWASFTPGLLGMIMGFILTSYAIMFFILFMGVRIMWLSMKQLSPTYQAAQ